MFGSKFWHIFALMWILLAGRATTADFDTDPDVDRARQAPTNEAVPLYRALTEKYPARGVIWYEYGTVLYEAMLWSDSLAAFRKAQSLDFDTPSTWMKIGKAHAKLKQFDAAEVAFKKSLALRDNVAARFGLASALFSQEKWSEALPLFQTLADSEDEWGSVAREFLAETQFELGNFEAARDAAEVSLAANPTDVNLRWLLGRSLFKLRAYEAALTHFRAISSDPKRGDGAKFYIAASLEGLGRLQEAEQQYRALSSGESVWATEARLAAVSLAGKAFYLTINYETGYETGVVRPDSDIAPIDGKDGFNQVFADIRGRPWRTIDYSFWMGLEHYELHYYKLHDNDYFLDAARAEFVVHRAGVLRNLTLRYKFKYAFLDYESYQREHQGELFATYAKGSDRIRFGAFGSDSTYFGVSSGLTGPRAGVFFDYSHNLPNWDHQFSVRGGAEHRFSRNDASERSTQRVAAEYRAQIWDVIYGQITGGYVREEYPHGTLAQPSRTDHRYHGEVLFDARVSKNILLNLNYRFERQESPRPDQQYKQHHIGAGFTFSF